MMDRLGFEQRWGIEMGVVICVNILGRYVLLTVEPRRKGRG